MTAPTIGAVRAHIGTKVLAYPGMTTPQLLNAANHYIVTTLPAAQVFSGAVLSSETIDASRALETRQYYVDWLVALIDPVDNDEVLYNGLAAAEDLLSPVKRYLKGALRKGGLIHDVGELTDVGVGNTPYRQKTYAFFRILIPITTVE